MTATGEYLSITASYSSEEAFVGRSEITFISAKGILLYFSVITTGSKPNFSKVL